MSTHLTEAPDFDCIQPILCRQGTRKIRKTYGTRPRYASILSTVPGEQNQWWCRCFDGIDFFIIRLFWYEDMCNIKPNSQILFVQQPNILSPSFTFCITLYCQPITKITPTVNVKNKPSKRQSQISALLFLHQFKKFQIFSDWNVDSAPHLHVNIQIVHFK